jgi:sugar phosphate isomerase/epimerase
MAAQVGFDAVEVLVDHRWDSRHPAYLRRLSQETSLPIAAVHNPFKPFVPGWPGDTLGRLQESTTLAREVGAPVVVAHLPLRIRGALVELFGFRRQTLTVPIPSGGEKTYRHFLLNGLAELETEQGVRIGVENMPVRRFLGRTVNLHWLNDLEGWSCMPHITLDTTHIGTWGFDLLEVYERLKERIAHVHLSDFDGKEHRLPGAGHLPLAGLLQRLHRDGYQGAVSLEVGPEVLQAEDECQALAHLGQALGFCREHAAG